MTKILVGIVVLLIAVVGGLFVWKTYVAKTDVPPAPVAQEPAPLNTYASSTSGVSISYPKEFILDDTYAYDQFGEKKRINGVKFSIPMTMAAGTNLSGSDTGISIESLPRAKNCTGDIYLPADVKAYDFVEGSTEYSVATSSGAAAGNFYEEIVYAVASSTPCTAVRYFIHSSNIGNYATGTVREFDRAALLREFDEIRQSLKFTR